MVENDVISNPLGKIVKEADVKLLLKKCISSDSGVAELCSLRTFVKGSRKKQYKE